MLKDVIGSTALARLVLDHRRQSVAVAGVLVAVLATLLAFGVSERSASAQSEPETVGRVTGLTATTESQQPGTVHLTWNAADDAQVYFVLYLEEDDFTAGNYGGIQMRAFNRTEGTIDGLTGGTSYRFYATGMRWNFGNFGAVWGAWSQGATATPRLGGVPSDAPIVQSEPEIVGRVAGLTATDEGQPPGAVRLTWNPADDAQVYFILYLKEDDFTAGNYGGIQMRAFNSTEGTIDGMAGGTPYRFYATGMRWNFGNFGAVWGAWSEGATATPAPAPALVGISLADLEHGAWLEENKPALAEQLKALPWVTDGVDYSERAAAEALIAAAIWYPDTFSALRQMVWVVDSVTEHETTAIERIRWTAQDAPALADRILAKPWVQDDITRDEATVIEYLYWTIRAEDESLQQELIQKAMDILGMPFLDTVESPDAMAVRDLRAIAYYGSSDFLAIMASPKVSDGITNQEAKVVAALSSAYKYKPDSLPVLLNGLDGRDGVYLQERNIDLPLAGEVLLAIIRLRDQVTPNMDYLELAVSYVEEFMDEILPTNYVAWYFDDATITGGGHNSFTHIASNPRHDDVDDPYWQHTPAHIAHEAAHYYWRGFEAWLNEGPANFLESLSENARIGTPVEASSRPCAYAANIAELEPLETEPGDDAFICNYSLGERFFLDLYHTLGREPFQQGFRGLYLKSQHNAPTDDCEGAELNICHLEVAFKTGVSDNVAAEVNEIVDRWYHGTEPYDLSRLDDSPVAPSLPSINGQITKAYITLDQDNWPPESRTNLFSPGDIGEDEQAYLYLEFTFPRTAALKVIPLEYVQVYEDGFVFNRRTVNHEFNPEWDTGWWRFPVASPPSYPWALGRYWVYVYDGDRKVAEVQYEVVP